MYFQLRTLNKNDLQLVLKWRNSDRVRSNMFNDKIISWDEHQLWFNRVKNDKRQKHLIFCILNEPVGIINFTQIDRQNGTCYWGFYIGKENVVKGAGTFMTMNGLDYAFNELKILKVIGEVLEFNQRSIYLHKKLGFDNIGYLKDRINKDSKNVGVYKFALHKQDWLLKREEILQHYEGYKAWQ